MRKKVCFAAKTSLLTENAVKSHGGTPETVEHCRFAQMQMLIFVDYVAIWADVCYTVDTTTQGGANMAMYEKMYAILCGAVSDAVDLMESDDNQGAIELLKAKLEELEELYINE